MRWGARPQARRQGAGNGPAAASLPTVKALFIDSAAREVRPVDLPAEEHARVAAIHDMIGGPLEAAWIWETGDCLYVDEEGWRHGWDTGFAFLPRRFENILGNGVVVGREVESPGGWTNHEPEILSGELELLCRFFVVRHA